MNICATILKKAAGDLLSMMVNVSYGISSIILLSFFSGKFYPVLYWRVILIICTAGTTMTGLGFGTISSSMILAILLIGFVIDTNIQEKRAAMTL